MKSIKLIMNIDTGEGSLSIPKEWDEMDVMFRVNVLQDWVHELTDLYNKTYDECFRDFD